MSRTYLAYAGVFLIALILQSTFVDFMQILSWKPDLPLIVLVIFAINYGRNAGSSAGFLVGLASDIISTSGVVGLGALSKTIAGYVAANIARYQRGRGKFDISRIIFTLFISGLVQDVVFFYVDTLGTEVSWWSLLRRQIAGSLLYTAIVGLVVYLLLDKWIVKNDTV